MSGPKRIRATGQIPHVALVDLFGLDLDSLADPHYRFVTIKTLLGGLNGVALVVPVSGHLLLGWSRGGSPGIFG
jgi:hypothetical protein